ACKVAGKDIDRAIVALSGWESEGDVPEKQDIYIRVTANPNTTSSTAQADFCSDLVISSQFHKLTVHPYYIALKDADPEMWYLIGACIGDGKWTNTTEGLGTSNFTMSITADGEYDKNTGKGVLVFNGYLTVDGFKIIRVRGDWTDQWGANDGTYVFQDGGSGNITVPANGFYKVTLNTALTTSDALTIEPIEATKKYDSICMAGSFNDWTDTPMTAFSTVEGVENHLWSSEIESDGTVELKFKIAGSWDTNWGGNTFPYGVGVNGGGNILVPEGSWIVTFNDVDGSYAFTSK
ncbi:MAG: SusF/SusE family outer membrane protein, partial [Bacteroidales bacterium]|nr:SusF/SusE family outer membrane protein [Bacteroidales bacterium]